MRGTSRGSGWVLSNTSLVLVENDLLGFGYGNPQWRGGNV
jgi:hypothetical protein